MNRCLFNKFLWKSTWFVIYFNLTVRWRSFVERTSSKNTCLISGNYLWKWNKKYQRNQQRPGTEWHRSPTRCFLIYQSFLLLCSKHLKKIYLKAWTKLYFILIFCKNKIIKKMTAKEVTHVFFFNYVNSEEIFINDKRENSQTSINV